MLSRSAWENSTGKAAMNLLRRQLLHLAAGAAALPLSLRIAKAEDRKSPPPESQRSVAERLAAYAADLRYEDLDDATIESVKVHLIDSIGCGLAAFDEKPVRICRDVTLANGAAAELLLSARRGRRRRILQPSPMAPPFAIST